MTMAADWEEIRRLAADFQRAQFAETAQRLSERNCIEIVTKLIAQKQLDVVYTLDGKEYITPAQIGREIRDELYDHGGRINVVDLHQIINVDLVHIESKANEIAKSDQNIQLVLGQLIDEKYLDRLAEEVNDKLQESGQVAISELCKAFDLPGDFLTEALSQRLGRIIHGHLDRYDRGVLFTEAFVSRHKARIRGLFSAVTRPTAMNSLITKYGFQEHLLYSVIEELVNSGRLKGTVVGGRQDKAVFIPDIYSKTQNNWVDSFFKQNGFLEMDALSRLGIPDPVSYIKKRYKSKQLLLLNSVYVGQGIVDQIEASVEDAISSGTWTDIEPLLPSSFSVEDAAVLLQQEMTNNPVFLLTEEDLKQGSLVTENAAMHKKDKKEERRKKASEGGGSLRSGGGSNAREIRTRKTKKKGRKEDDSDEEASAAAQSKNKQHNIPFMSQEEIEEVLTNHLQDCPDTLVAELAEHLIRPLTKTYQEVMRSVFMSSTSSSSGSSRKQTVKDLKEEVSNIYNSIRLFEKGLKFFADDTQVNLARHLLRTVCTDATNLIFNFLAADLMLAVEDHSTITNEVRNKILSMLPEETKSPLTKLNSSLNGKSIEDFISVLDTVSEFCGILLKKGDKKKERQVMYQHRQALMDQLKLTEDPALVLHLTSVLLFQLSTHCMLNAPGRCVPQIIGFLSTKIPQDQYSLLIKYQGLVVKKLVGENKRSGQEDESTDNKQTEDAEAEVARKEMLELTPAVKDLVFRSRKTSLTEE
ncbi:E3 UFM1-protein ligase 1 isoform X2 [Protopterus annectens]|uniref:E3 UFM1-protein ligase 1 isoform X2 n=1 Tax=Protopterus annectens TaxID=7888 RepID=UPI001CFAAFB5|nr:E3 UFM1-protein ligase 1 isoform X2 [Protopterus annectens]